MCISMAMGVPKMNGLEMFRRENLTKTRMMTGGTPILENPQITSNYARVSWRQLGKHRWEKIKPREFLSSLRAKSMLSR